MNKAGSSTNRGASSTNRAGRCARVSPPWLPAWRRSPRRSRRSRDRRATATEQAFGVPRCAGLPHVGTVGGTTLVSVCVGAAPDSEGSRSSSVPPVFSPISMRSPASPPPSHRCPARGLHPWLLVCGEPPALSSRCHLRRGSLQVRSRQRTPLIASLRYVAISLLRQAGDSNITKALRHHSGDPLRPVELLLTS